MTSFIYLYSKFTEEFLLFFSTGFFALFAAYGYYWVVRRRRLGTARDLVPAAVVRSYLNQMIGEAQFVRTQLFGLLGDQVPAGNFNAAMFQAPAQPATAAAAPSAVDAIIPVSNAEVPSDILDRLKAMEKQLNEKEGLISSINVEKTKLLEQLETINKTKPDTAGASTGDLEAMLKKIKELEGRLEEYSIIEDDLANLKRLQTENAALKKKIESGSIAEPTANVAPVPVAESAPQAAAPSLKIVQEEAALPTVPKAKNTDQEVIDSFLSGESPTPPQAIEKPADPELTLEPAIVPEPIAKSEPTGDPVLAAAMASMGAGDAPAAAAPESDLDAAVSESLAATGTDGGAVPEAVAEAKSDEELLKEFEKLLNS